MFIHEALGKSVNIALCYGSRSCQVPKPGAGTVLGTAVFTVADGKVSDAGRWRTGLESDRMAALTSPLPLFNCRL